MRIIIKSSRREFLKSLGALSAAGVVSNLDVLGGFANVNAQQASDYKALVCVFLYGGVDGNNVVVPADTAGYAQYAAVRTTASGINIPLASLNPIQPASLATPFGLHPSMPELKSLFDQRKMAVLCNVGTLLQPTTKADYAAGRYRPSNLFSHSDQQTEWQTAVYDQNSRTGWGGRLADRIAGMNGATAFPVVTSTSGITLFMTGSGKSPLSVPTSGSFGLQGYTTANAANNARLAAIQQLLDIDQGNLFVGSASEITSTAVDLSVTVNPILSNDASSVQALFNGQTSSIAKQLLAVAKLIEARNTIGIKRQIFFVSLGGFDTHTNELSVQQTLFGQLSPALKAFSDATEQLGVGSSVTTFTLSDFGRTFKPAAGQGSDHAWGNHALIIGGAVKGGDFYGKYPTLQLSGPDDVTAEGRWLPSTAVDQYAATLATWFGLPASDLASVLPTIGKFPSANLGFMN
ncbi:MAG: DUF1501 domain-containing protein [Betaproteobacteria bacterium]